MAKGFLLGLTLGGVAAFAAYQALSDEKKEELHGKIIDTKEDLKEQFTDYALYAQDLLADLADDADFYGDVKDKVQNASDKLADKKDQVLDKFNKDAFDEQTASIREQLSAADEDDIIIDLDEDDANIAEQAEKDNKEK